jgi:outer membrane lipoprotein-sorting protein
MRRLDILVCSFAAAIFVLSQTASAAEDVASILAKIDNAGARTKTISADFNWKTVQTEPVSDEEIQVGSIFFKRDDRDSFEMAANIRTVNGKSVPKILTYAHGIATLFEKLPNQFHSFKAGDKESLLNSLLFIGFGANGHDLTKNFDLKFIRSEILNGINCDVLKLTPTDEKTRERLLSVMIWFDVARGIGIKQVFDEGEGTYRECLYTNIKINPHLPPDAFRQR